MECAICGRGLGSGATYCIACGFPPPLAEAAPEAVALAAELPSIAPLEDSAPARASATGPGGLLRAADGDESADREAEEALQEALPRVARDLTGRVALVQRFGDPAKDAEAEMRQAALVQADGRLSEALHLLREASARVYARSRDILDRRIAELEARGARLGEAGVRVRFDLDPSRLRTDLEAGRSEEALKGLSEADRQLSGLEACAVRFRDALAQIEALRDQARAAGVELADPTAELRRLRETLAETPANLETLEVASRSAEAALTAFRGTLSQRLQEAVEALGPELDRLPPDSEATRDAGARREEAFRHLSRSRTAEAVESLLAARRIVDELAPPPESTGDTEPARDDEPSDGEPSVGGSDAGDDDGGGTLPSERLGGLLLRARELASRVRSLPPDSAFAPTAAERILQATELLRARNLEEADRTLRDLMRALDEEAPAEPAV